MKKIALIMLTLVGCGGAAFSSVGDPVVEAGTDARADSAGTPADSGGVHDATGDAVDSVAPEADAGDGFVGDRSVVDGSVGDVSVTETAPPVEAGPPCCAAPTAACSTPLTSCLIASENHGSFPLSFEVYFDGAENCMTVATPSVCLCDYTCACIEPTYTCQYGIASCTNDPIQGLLIVCND